MLISFALAPIVARFERASVSTALSVFLIATCTFALLGGLGYVITQQVVQVAESLPRYRENIADRLRVLQAGSEGGPIGQAARMVGEIQEQIQKESDEKKATDDQEATPTPPAAPRSRLRAPKDDGGAKEPVLVRIQEPPPSTLDVLESVLGPAFPFFATAAIVVVFVVFFLLQRRDLRDRIVRVAGQSRLDLTTQAMDEATSRISRYLLAQVTLNVSYGVPVMIGLWLIGVPGAVLWGFLAGLLRFIPYVGPWIGASMPVLVSLAVFPGWLWPFAVVGLFVLLELFSNNVLEPWLYGASTGLSAVAVIVAAVFWSWLWGPVGLLLAVPLTVCVFVMGKYLPQLQVLTILLGREPALSPDARLYQRTLAGDEGEARQLLERFREEHGVLALYDEVLLPALHLKERDHHGGRLDSQREERVQEDFEHLVDELIAWTPADGGETASDRLPNAAALLCLPARDDADELSGRLLAHVARLRGIDAVALSAFALVAEMQQEVERLQPRVVCVAAVPPAAISPARYLCLRLRQTSPDLRIVVGLWDWHGDASHARARLRAAGADHVTTSLSDALAHVGQVLGFHRPEPRAEEPAETART